jgi:hypothetical protein
MSSSGGSLSRYCGDERDTWRPTSREREAAQNSERLMSCQAGQFYSKVFSCDLLAGSKQFVIPPVRATK